jgi:SAM-dependent methyltransferase
MIADNRCCCAIDLMLNHLLRYEPVVQQLDAIPGRKLLEVGSGSRGIARYLPACWEVTACDLSFDDYRAPVVAPAGHVRRIEASVLELPFEDASFDVVIALDLLEHLPAQDRPQALAQLRRVADRCLIVGCPTGPAALRSDERLSRFYQRTGTPSPLWLEEHLRNGFPAVSDLTRELTDHGQLALYANESLRTHALVSRLEATPIVWRLTNLLSSVLAAGLKSARWAAASRRALSLLRADQDPSYRTIAVLSLARPRT